jgi:hypothetical protein
MARKLGNPTPTIGAGRLTAAAQPQKTADLRAR